MSKHTLVVVTAFLLLQIGCRGGQENAKSDVISETTTSADQTTTGATGGTVTRINEPDKVFMSQASQAGMAEVSLGQTAEKNAANADVKSFATRMVTDHGNAGAELNRLATEKGVGLPTEPDEDQKGAAARLSGLTGSAFDKAYMEQMVADHEKAVSDFENASNNAVEADVKAWAAKTLPALKEHLRMAKEINGKLK